MKNFTRIIILLLVVSAILIPTTAFASGFEDDKVIFGSNYTLREGETLNGDLIVLGGNVNLESSSTVNGDTVVFGGNVTVNGTINGNLVALGGIVVLEDEALIQGDLTVVSGSYEQSSGAIITGSIITEENIPFEFELPENGLFEGNFPFPRFKQLPFVSASWFFFRVLIWSGLAILIGLFIEDQAVVINRSAFREPVMSFVVGLGVVVVAPFVMLALIVTILLSPVSLVGIFALITAWIVGLVSLSIEVGRKLLQTLNQTLPVPLLAGIGMFIITLIFNGFSQIVPCVGWLPRFILGSWVIGAVILTRFGTHAYPDKGEQPAGEIVPESSPVKEIPEAFPSKVSVDATQAAIELAEKEGIDLAAVSGTGAAGRITLNDVRKAIKDRG
jgi:pyruvate/2-oxoglutarate dehydrogenase complex dihydrolipoamide acyltransferase (E2) component